RSSSSTSSPRSLYMKYLDGLDTTATVNAEAQGLRQALIPIERPESTVGALVLL
ncbi:hypothetical protein CIB48_g10390, partial [Xylaria polymorpha]